MFLRFFKFFTSFILAALTAVLGIVLTFVVDWVREMPDYRQLDTLTRSLGSETKVYARDNTSLGKLIPRVGEQVIGRTIVRLDEVSPYMIAALVANEDRTFFEHYGMDIKGLARQVVRVFNGQSLQGGSTITNQLIKNTLLADLEQARTVDRKVKEWILSMQVERSFTKEEILQDYLNAIYWGDGGPLELYGIHSAAQSYLKKSPKKLSIAQAVYLTTLIPSPIRYFDYKATRENYMKPLLDRMVEDRWITSQQRQQAWQEKLQPSGWKIKYDAKGNITSAKLVDKKAKHLKRITMDRAPHFLAQVERELVRRFGREKVYGSGGLRVYTTLDPKIQNAVETASREAKVPRGTTLGATIIDPYNGEVLGMIGQKLYGNNRPSDWNNAAQGQRQIGSTIKPLLYTTAIAGGLGQNHREYDGPISIRDSRGGYYRPRNFEGQTSFRTMTLREALDKSLNLVTVRLAQRVGLRKFFNKLEELEIPPNEGTEYAAALGAVEATPVQMAATYAPFVNGGLFYTPRYVSRVTDARGSVLFDAVTDSKLPTRIWSPQVAFVGLDMIKGVVNDLDEQQGGLAFRAKFGQWPVAGKTGTSNGPKDLWFVGTTPVYSGAVWIGRQQGGNMSRTTYSGEYNPPIWRRMMQVAHANLPVQQFVQPPGVFYDTTPDPQWLPKIKVAAIDPKYRQTTEATLESERPRPVIYKEAAFSPNERDPSTKLINIDKRTGRIATEFTPPENVAQRRVYIEQLPGYAPEKSPSPLKDEEPNAEAVKLVRSQGAVVVPEPETTEEEEAATE